MGRIHFVSLFSVEYDYDLIDFWVKHYRKFNFDSYKVFLHSNIDFHYSNKIYKAKSVFNKNGFDVEIVRGRFVCGQLRIQYLEPYHESLPKDDYIATSDSDEFWECPDNIKDIAVNYDVVKGSLIDRFDNRLHAANSDDPLGSQYPNRGYVESLIEDVDGWPKVKKDKILIIKCKHSVNYDGSHMARGKNLSVYDKSFLVDHYSYRDTYLERMAGKEYFLSGHILAMMRFFKYTDTKVYDKEVRKEIDLQKDKGWYPMNIIKAKPCII